MSHLKPVDDYPINADYIFNLMNRKFSLLLLGLIIPISYFGVEYALKVGEINNFDQLPFSINDSIKIATQKGILRNGKLFLVCQNNNLLRLVYKARFPFPARFRRGNQIRFDAILSFSKRSSDAYESFELDLSQPVTLQNEKGFLFDWLTTIFTEPLLGDESDSMIRFLKSKTYSHISFFGLETGTYFKLDHEHLDQRMPVFLAKCRD